MRKVMAKDIWDSLKQKYQGITCAKCPQLQALYDQFEVLYMKIAKLINDYFSTTITISNKM